MGLSRTYTKRAVWLVALLVVTIIAVMLRSPQQQPGGQSAHFDFWVLALSWSPTYCTQEGVDDEVQCGEERRPGFVVHGLWPQYERGYPADCDIGPERIAYRFAREMADLIPSPRLVFHQWRKHGRCSGLTPEGYFHQTRRAAETVRIPDHLMAAPAGQHSPAEIETAFADANPGLGQTAMAAICQDGKLREVRICMTKDLAFRSCSEVDSNACPIARMSIPAMQ